MRRSGALWTLLVTFAVSGSLALACAYPESSTRSVDESPSLLIQGAPEGAILVVDGIPAGAASDYSEDRSLRVLPGRHVVEITRDGVVLARREVFVDAQTMKTLDFTGVGR